MRRIIVPAFASVFFLRAGGVDAAPPGPDFDGDGFDDLAVGVRQDNLGAESAGSVNVIYGAGSGLTVAGDQLWHQERGGIATDSEPFDHFGESVAFGDFNGDGFDDLAVGVPSESLGNDIDCGAVHIIYGDPDGLRSADSQFIHQDTGSLTDQSQDGDRFGEVLESGDFNGDGFSDLAIGTPAEERGGFSNSGCVHVLFGSEDGLDVENSQFLHGDELVGTGLDRLGEALAAGDFNGDGADDLAIGLPFRDTLEAQAGMVIVLSGVAGGRLQENNVLVLIQNQFEESEANDHFGLALGAGDFNGDGFADLVIGAPDEDFESALTGGVSDAGIAHVIYGTDAGLNALDHLIIHQDQPGVRDELEGDDALGGAFASGDLNGDGFDDLVVGVPLENVRELGDQEGAVHVFFGSVDGVTFLDDRFIHQDSNGMEDEPEDLNRFGFSLGTSDFDDDGFEDLVIGVFAESTTFVGAGAVHVLYGSENGPRTHASEFWHQDASGVRGDATAGEVFGFSVPR